VRTGERRFRDLTVITAPDDIGRVRLLLSTAKAIDQTCLIGLAVQKRILIDMRVDWSFNGYDEKFRLPDRDLLLRCRICAINSEAIRSRWTNSRAVYISRTQMETDRLE
ncbi:hypothetical protein Tcan_01878, partial [Toxocara canis]